MNRIDLAGQIAVVAGGAGGIGLETARRLAASGARVAIWDLNEAALGAAANALPEARTTCVDMMDETAVSAAMEAVQAEHGRLDILVSCTGQEARRCAVVDWDVAAWRRSLEINLTTTFIASKFAVREMMKRDYGRIVTMSSTSGKDGNPFDSPYATAKAGIMGLTKSLGKELATTGIRVNCVCPAAIDSPLFARLPPEQKQFSIGKIPLGRLGKMDEVAALIAWLCSEECSFSTGAVFDISGGRSTY
ncbi:MAG: SDR family oxidoreductase [Proteobacteria bacterium]|nr:SDR family oxidoreductase [Pseudomonadota bacterium]